MADGGDGHAGAPGEVLEGNAGAAHVLVVVGAEATLEEGDEGIDDDQGDIETGDDLIQRGEVGGDGEELSGAKLRGEVAQGENALGVAASSSPP